VLTIALNSSHEPGVELGDDQRGDTGRQVAGVDSALVSGEAPSFFAHADRRRAVERLSIIYSAEGNERKTA
jgi:hypothetical protein